MRKLLLTALLSTAFGAAHAEFSIPGYELVLTNPVETDLPNPDLRDPATVWSEMFDNAKKEIVFGHFYAVVEPGSPFEKVMERLEAAGKRGVKIRFLLDMKGVNLSEASTLERLKAIPNLELRILDFSRLTGNGIIHAKYMVVDKSVAFMGSQNFDWRSFSHIHETGLRITDAKVVGQVQAIFENDWRAQHLLEQGKPVPTIANAATSANYAPDAILMASPYPYNPPGVADSERGLPAMLGEAQKEVRVQLLDYAPLSYGPKGTRPYYAAIDNAVRTAAQRGVKIKLMVSNWNLEMPGQSFLKSLALVPNVEIRIVTLPKASTGFIPFARVIHSKTMSVDGKLAWVGTSNWSGGYMDMSRNLEMVLRNESMAQRIGALHEQLWTSPYAAPLDVSKQYPRPAKGKEE